MEPNPILFRDLTYIFVAAVFGGLIAWRLRLPLILGFVLGGIAVSPFTPGPHLSDLHSFELLAEVGVVLLMFSIGVEFSIPELLRVKYVALIGGPIGILLMVALAFGVGKLVGWSTSESLVIGAGVSVASTMVLARLLSDSGELSTTHGRVMIGITIVEDLAVICMTVVVPVLANSQNGGLGVAAWVLGKAILLLIPLIFVAVKVIPPLLRQVKRTCNTELELLFAVAICLGTAALAQAVGFSVALGAFLAGVSISSLPELHDAHTQILPLRDAFVALFFVTLGTLINPKVLFDHLPLLGWMLLLVVVGKFLVWATVVSFFGYPLRTAIGVAAGLTQIGELSFIVVEVARSSGLVDESVFSTVIAASLISILINVLLVRLAFRWIGKTVPEQAAIAPQTGAVVEITKVRNATHSQETSSFVADQTECWPALPLDSWKETCETLHMWTQIVGKVRLALTPRVNHWWNVPLYVTARGLTTSRIPYGIRSFELWFDFLQHRLVLETNDGVTKALALTPRSVADFYQDFTHMLRAENIEVRIWPVPVEIPNPIRFDQDRVHASYDSKSVEKFWRILLSVDSVFNQFRAGFVGKSSPVHFFWGSFDLAVTRFSGRPAPARPGADPITQEAYSHEVSSVGFWPGSGDVHEPTLYCYAAPEPEGFKNARVRPDAAFYSKQVNEFLLRYEDVRRSTSPVASVLVFCESTYEAAASFGNWDRGNLERQYAQRQS